MHSPKCPVLDPRRKTWSTPVDNEEIMYIAQSAYDHGFEGMIGFHFYNEPLMDYDRMRILMDGITHRVPRAEYILWTNGELLREDMMPYLDRFSVIKISDYFGKDFSWLHRSECPIIDITKVELDCRTSRTDTYKGEEGCLRVFNELIIDYWGWIHPCCQDWEGEIDLGNVHETDLFSRDPKWIEHRAAVAVHMEERAHPYCRKCDQRNALGDFCGPVNERIRRMLQL
jgi:radical SAM protein with 4Fe4S-binding SPASM domain